VDVTSVNAFKGRLERRRRHQMDLLTGCLPETVHKQTHRLSSKP